MITWIEIKDTFRNKRFILFTVVFPLAWYLMMLSVFNGAAHHSVNRYLWFTIAAIIGISGNSVVTFSKKYVIPISFINYNLKLRIIVSNVG